VQPKTSGWKQLKPVGPVIVTHAAQQLFSKVFDACVARSAGGTSKRLIQRRMCIWPVEGDYVA
jgi:hypothetical protein